MRTFGRVKISQNSPPVRNLLQKWNTRDQLFLATEILRNRTVLTGTRCPSNRHWYSILVVAALELSYFLPRWKGKASVSSCEIERMGRDSGKSRQFSFFRRKEGKETKEGTRRGVRGEVGALGMAWNLLKRIKVCCFYGPAWGPRTRGLRIKEARWFMRVGKLY